jgi:predicted amidohydrolase
MPAASIILLLMIAFVASRLFRSTKMWWTFLSTIMAGLLVGMLGREVIGHIDDNKTSQTQLIETTNTVDLGCMQSLVVFAESDATTCLTGVAGNIPKYTESLRDIVLISNTETNGRDSPSIEDDS